MANLTDEPWFYAEEMKRLQDRYGPGAEVPRMPSVGMPIGRVPIAARIADLAKQIAEAGHQMAEARAAFDAASRAKSAAESHFVDVSNQLFAAIQEHREGTPEGVPYQP